MFQGRSDGSSFPSLNVLPDACSCQDYEESALFIQFSTARGVNKLDDDDDDDNDYAAVTTFICYIQLK